MQKKVLVFLAEGFEEVEAITPIDYLRRAGIDVTSAAIGVSIAVTGSHGIKISADSILSQLKGDGLLDASAWDAVIVPGGLPGADNIAASNEACSFLLEMSKAGKFICAICAAPARVLAPLNLLKGRIFTCFPGEEAKVLAPGSNNTGAVWKEDRVIVDRNIVTSRGAGTAGEFSSAIIDQLLGEGEGKKIADRVLL